MKNKTILPFFLFRKTECYCIIYLYDSFYCVSYLLIWSSVKFKAKSTAPNCDLKQQNEKQNIQHSKQWKMIDQNIMFDFKSCFATRYIRFRKQKLTEKNDGRWTHTYGKSSILSRFNLIVKKDCYFDGNWKLIKNVIINNYAKSTKEFKAIFLFYYF